MRLNLLDGLLFLSMKLLKSLDKRQTDLEHLNQEKTRSILVVSSTAIGDTLLSTPAIRAVREQYPKAKIIGHFNAGNMELFANNPHIDGIIPYYGGYKHFFKTIKTLRKHCFDLVLIFHGNEPQATPMAYLSGAGAIIKLPNTSEYRFLLSNADKVLKWSDFGHGSEQRFAVARLAGCRMSDNRMVLPVSEASEAAADDFLRGNGIRPEDTIIGFQVAASTISRMWFAERFIELGKRLNSLSAGIKIVITGSPPEYAYCLKIAKGTGNTAVVSAGKVSLQHMPALVRKFSALVTGDTGIMHMAIAVGTPVVALFAAADAKKSGPYYDLEKHRVIQKEMTCNPCISKRCTYQKCMENISVDEVFDAIKDVIAKSHPKH